MRKIILTFPWPDSELNPNRRVYFRKRAEIKARYKRDCNILAKSYPRPIFEDGDIGITMTFNPSSHRKHDLDNLLASMKSGLDGIAEHWGVDDQRFNPITIRRGEVRKNGSVEITLD